MLQIRPGLKKKNGKIKSEAYFRFQICRTMGWDYYTYISQPQFFIDEIAFIINQENDVINKEPKNKNGTKTRTNS